MKGCKIIPEVDVAIRSPESKVAANIVIRIYETISFTKQWRVTSAEEARAGKLLTHTHRSTGSLQRPFQVESTSSAYSSSLTRRECVSWYS